MGRILCYFKHIVEDSAVGSSQDQLEASQFQIKGVIHIAKPVVRAPKTRRPEYYCMRLNANAILGAASAAPDAVLATPANLITEANKKYIIGTTAQGQMEGFVQKLRQVCHPHPILTPSSPNPHLILT